MARKPLSVKEGISIIHIFVGFLVLYSLIFSKILGNGLDHFKVLLLVITLILVLYRISRFFKRDNMSGYLLLLFPYEVVIFIVFFSYTLGNLATV